MDPTGIPQCDTLLKRYEACSVATVAQAGSRRAEGTARRRDGHARRGERSDELRPDLERYCADTFEQMKKESDIKECMSKP